jgi:hypothetical protein
MANALYDKGREAFLKGQINWIDDTIKVALVRTPAPNASPASNEYKVNLVTHQFLSAVPLESIISTQTLIRSDADGHADNGIANAADITFENVVGKVGALVIYKQSATGDRSSSRLIVYLDQLNGLPYEGVGGNVKIQWDNGINKIFKL